QALDFPLFRDLEIGTRPNLVERTVKRHAATAERIGEVLIGQSGLQRRLYESVAGRLRTREGTRVAAQERKMSGDFGPDRHNTPSRADNVISNVLARQLFRQPIHELCPARHRSDMAASGVRGKGDDGFGKKFLTSGNPCSAR